MSGYCKGCGLRREIHCACPADPSETIALVVALVIALVAAAAVYFKTHEPYSEPQSYERPPRLERAPWLRVRSAKA